MMRLARMLRDAGRQLTIRVLALWWLARDRRTPWAVRLLALLVVAYAASPIDLIPDFIPVLGQLDDLVLLPLAVWLAVRMCPRALWAESLQRAQETSQRLPRLRWGAVLVVLTWLLVAVLIGLAAALLLAPGPAQARSASESIEGTVSRVVDGDTLEFRPAEASRALIAVRLRGIDAPERCQAWGRQATAALKAEAEGRTLRLQVQGQDEYRRTLGTLRRDGLDLNRRLVEQGHAWAWRDAHGRSPYLQAEERARAARAGLHASESAQPPWEFRQINGRCRR